jgi:metallo-beta-lactamase family protein
VTGTTLTCFGAARTVTGSRHVLDVGGRRLLLDCGLFQGRRQESDARNRRIETGGPVDAVLLSHAHIDHSGGLPSLVREGYRGPVYATPATADLCEPMLLDSARLAEADAGHLNRHRAPGLPRIQPVQTVEDAVRVLHRFRPVPYGRPFEPVPGVRATFREAGHILGSAGVLVEPREGASVYFTGDLGRRLYPILRDPDPVPDADAVVCEATYGNRDHEPLADAEAKIRAVIERARAERGKVFVPAFSVGRTQNLVYAFARRRAGGALPPIPVYVDSPLSAEATRAFAAHPECFDDELKAFIRAGGDPFYPAGVTYVESVEASKALNGRPGPFLVIAASGMCEGGRILHHLLHGLDDPRNTVLFVGWAAPNTLARKLIDGATKVRVLDHEVEVRARVEQVGALSAHADRREIREFLDPARRRGSSIHLVHGDEEACLALAETLRAAGHRDVHVPELAVAYALSPRARAAGGPAVRPG